MSMKLGLELMAIVSSDFLDAKRELFDYKIDEVYCILEGAVTIRVTLGEWVHRKLQCAATR